MKKDEKEPTYGQAIAEIEAILKDFDNENFDVDALAARVKRATELIGFCRSRLNKAEQEVADALK